MKKVVAILVGCLIVAAAFAGGPDMPSPFVFSAVPTNAAAVNSTAGSVTSAVPLDAWIDTVIVDVGGGGGSPTSTIVVSTQAGLGTGAARTLLTLTDIAADASYPVRDYAVSQTGVDHTTPVVRIPLVGDKLIVQAYNANTTTNTATVYVILSPVP